MFPPEDWNAMSPQPMATASVIGRNEGHIASRCSA